MIAKFIDFESLKIKTIKLLAFYWVGTYWYWSKKVNWPWLLPCDINPPLIYWRLVPYSKFDIFINPFSVFWIYLLENVLGSNPIA